MNDISAAGMNAGANPGTSSPAHALRRELGFRDLMAYGLAYIAPVAPLSTLGFVWEASGGLIALAYLLGATCMYFTAKSYAVMTELVPNAGSVYGFARYGLGVLPGFAAGWLVLLDYLLIPALIFLLMSVGMEIVMPGLGRAAWICILVVTSLFINWFGVVVSSRFNQFSVAGQFVIMLGIVAVGIYALYHGQGSGALTLAPFYDAARFDTTKVLHATSICVLSFLGFDAISTLAEEVKGNDRKLVGKAIIAVLVVCGTIFVVATWVLGNLLADFAVQDPAAAIFELLKARISPWSAVALAWLLALIVGFTNVLPMQIGVSRVLFAMARDRQLPSPFAKLHPKNGTPHVALLFSTLISFAVAMVMRDRIDELASFVNFGALSAFFLLHVSVLFKLGIQGRSKRYFVHWFVPLAGMAVVTAVLSQMAPLAVQFGVAWLLIGLAYGFYLRKRNRAELTL